MREKLWSFQAMEDTTMILQPRPSSKLHSAMGSGKCMLDSTAFYLRQPSRLSSEDSTLRTERDTASEVSSFQPVITQVVQMKISVLNSMEQTELHQLRRLLMISSNIQRLSPSILFLKVTRTSSPTCRESMLCHQSRAWLASMLSRSLTMLISMLST